MAKPRKQQSYTPEPIEDDQKVYGFLLIIRWLAFLAIELREKNPATLAVAVVLAEYMKGEKKGRPSDSSYMCRVSRYSIADRLGVTQQSVQGHINILKQRRFLAGSHSGAGSSHYFWIPDELQERFETERHRWTEANEARDERKAIRKAAREQADMDRKAGQDLRSPPKQKMPSSAKTAGKPFEAWSQSRAGHSPASGQSEVTGSSLSPSQAAPCHPDRLHPVTVTGCSLSEETFLDTSKESVQEKGAGAPASPCGSPGAAPQEHGTFAVGDHVQRHGHPGKVVAIHDGGRFEVSDGASGALTYCTVDSLKRAERVYHIKFGHGTVTCRDENKVTVLFDRAGTKRVHSDYLEPAA